MREELSPAMRQEGQIIRNDISVPVGRMPELIARGLPLIAELVPGGRLLPFGHVGDGNLHFNILLPMDTADLDAAARAHPARGLRPRAGARRLDQRRARHRPAQGAPSSPRARARSSSS